MSKFTVCPACEGEGYVGTLGAFTPDEFYEAFDDIDDYENAHEASKVACKCCNGKRVVTQTELAEYEEYLDYEAEKSAESRYFGGY
jgi:RecJ-like exonuclease